MTWPLLLIAFYAYGLSGPYSVGKFLAVATVGLWLALGGFRRIGIPIVYIAVVVLTTLLSTDHWTSTVHLWGTNTAGMVAALMLIPYWACVGPEDREGVEAGIRWGAALCAVVALMQRFGVEAVTPFPLPTGDRAYGTMGSPIYMGALLALAWPFLKYWPLHLLVAGALWASGSRGAWLAVAAGAIYEYWPLMSKRVRLWGVIGTGAALIAAFWLRPISDLGRVMVWYAAWDAFWSRPWFGWGAGNFYTVAQVFVNPLWVEVYGPTTQDHAHNFFMEAAATSGAIGLAALAALLWAMWRGADRISRASLVGVFVVGMLNPLPMVVKALAVTISATSLTSQEISRGTRLCCQAIVCAIFLVTVSLAAADHTITVFGDSPWSFSSEKAAYYLGIIRQEVTRRAFKI